MTIKDKSVIISSFALFGAVFSGVLTHFSMARMAIGGVIGAAGGWWA